MFEIKSFFKKNNDFIPAAEFKDVISDPDYIEGAIEISQWNKKILTIENWDYVDQLWCYFVEGIEKVSKGIENNELNDEPKLSYECFVEVDRNTWLTSSSSKIFR